MLHGRKTVLRLMANKPFQVPILAKADGIEFRSDDVIKMKFVKLWDLLTYSERTTSKTPTFWRVGVLDVVLSEYLNKSHNFTNFIFYDVAVRNSIIFQVTRY